MGPANSRPGVWSSGVGIPIADEIPSPAASRLINLGSFLEKRKKTDSICHKQLWNMWATVV